MCDISRVRWTVTPQTAPEPWIGCSGCGGSRPFRSSGKIRLNANGRKLDAWLIYRCSACEKTWNRPIFERRNVRDIDPVVIEALQSNDADWIRAEALNLEALRCRSQRIDEFPEFEIEKEILRDSIDPARLEIELRVPLPVSTRLDRLLASELNMPRSKLQSLHDRGALRIDRTGILRRRIRNGTLVFLDLAVRSDGAR